MLDPKKKKIYIIIICVCLVITVTVLIMGRSSVAPSGTDLTPTSSSVSPNDNLPVDQTVNTTASNTTATKGYTVPKVFPQSTNFDISVFQSSTFTTLRSFIPLSLQQNELGREDPFKTY